jgi:hypothetical protein
VTLLYSDGLTIALKSLKILCFQEIHFNFRSEKKYPKPVDVLLKKREPNYNPQPVPVEVLLKRREPKTAAKPLTARCQFHQHFMRTFLYKSAFHNFSQITVWLYNFLAKEHWRKSCS